MSPKFVLRALFASAALLSSGLTSTPANAQEGERIAAVVNEDIVSMRDLEERMKLAIISSRLENSPEVRRRLVPQVLRKLIDEKLQSQEAARQGIAPTENDVNKTIRNIEQQSGMPPGSLEPSLRREGVDFNSLLQQIKADITWVKLIRYRFGSSIKVTDAEIEAQLSQLKSNMSKPQYLLSEIVLNADTPAQEGEVRALAERIVQQNQQGAPFPALARQFSQTATAALGGDIGWVYEGQLPADIEATVKQLHPGQISNPIRTLTGFHIVFLRERRKGGEQDRSASQLDLTRIFLPLSDKASPQDVRTQTNLVLTTAQAAENCEDMVRLAKELNSPQSAKIGAVTLGSLPPELQSALGDLPAGKISNPVRLGGGVTVFMVCSRKDDNGLPSKEEISGRLEMERLDIQARRLMRDLRRLAIIDVRI
jgi:peptidyl-prolyl cis-trans isomerase SurA